MNKFWGDKQFQIDWWSLWASLRLVLISVAGFALEKFAEWVSNTDFGAYQGFVALVLMGLIELARKFLKDYSDENNNPPIG